eukprot:CAMPEP_0116540852 /NCGR_PEP_ID=MMETSP0397-20121206/170_1 /TAXON_ID=216820 /ORGANISM="Cyclophora tenuis, Strain ECT3854" /LENGTH=300 /DNA_ID=CAMNT_0004064755 /DNA_START=229 /DNA_END=1132 /DNA_ORIENTATION=+
MASGDTKESGKVGNATAVASGGVKYIFKTGEWVDGQYINTLEERRPPDIPYTKTIFFANGDEYRGEWVNGRFHGHGRFTFADNAFCEGHFVGGAFSGVHYYRRNGSKYTGKFKLGFPHGEGTLVTKDKREIKGQWWGGELDDPTKDCFERHFRRGFRNGRGIGKQSKYVFKTGEWEDGRYISNDEESRPPDSPYTKTLRFANGDEYQGAWLKGRFDGHGRFTFEDKSVCEGDFVGGAFVGVRSWKNGSYYYGEWKLGFPHGEGTLVTSDDQEITGSWWGGELQDASRDSYERHFRRGFSV